MDKDFAEGLRLVVGGLADAAKKASYSLGFGAGGLGVAILALSKLGVTGTAGMLLPVSSFLIMARIGKAVDDYYERRSVESNLSHYLQLENKLSKNLESKIDSHVTYILERRWHWPFDYREEWREQAHKLDKLITDVRQLEKVDKNSQSSISIKEECEKIRKELQQSYSKKWETVENSIQEAKKELLRLVEENKIPDQESLLDALREHIHELEQMRDEYNKLNQEVESLLPRAESDLQERLKDLEKHNQKLEQLHNKFRQIIKDEYEQLIKKECEDVRADLRKLFGERWDEVKVILDETKKELQKKETHEPQTSKKDGQD